ncbi:MAG: hypothetical protein IPM36_21465 [Lewinellaceae bacterium]|nr:hypothetical protein [Lewinellaceae bacterium]
MSNLTWSNRTDAAIAWLRRSIEVTGGKGSAHSYSPLWGWAAAYPETTGYLIPTLLRYAETNQDPSLRTLAGNCQNWLITTQLPGGAFPGGLAGSVAPSVFNTAMILFGLRNPVEKTLAESENIRRSLERAVSWLLGLLETDGAWRQAAYVPGFVPSYYTYAVWAVLAANRVEMLPEIPGEMRRALRFYAQRFRPDGTVADWGLRPGPAAFTHTIAYTLQGFLESAFLLDEPEILEKTLGAANGLLQEHSRAGRLAGRYGPGWQGDYSFSCPVGNAQLSVLFSRIGEVTGAQKFKTAAKQFLGEAARFQKLGSNRNTFGALPGSAPIWGPYLRWRYPNWGAKFFLDAVDALDKTDGILQD